jgi:hypothetical protein
MWKAVKALIVGLCLLVALSHSPASAQVTTKTPITSTSWTNVGTGPLFLSTIGQAWYVIAATTPALGVEGFPVPVGGVGVNAVQNVWVRLQYVPGLTPVSPAAYTYPISVGTISLGTQTSWGVAPVGGTQVANFNVDCVIGCSASTITSFTLWRHLLLLLPLVLVQLLV